jgi:hypothetical protein
MRQLCPQAKKIYLCEAIYLWRKTFCDSQVSLNENPAAKK